MVEDTFVIVHTSVVITTNLFCLLCEWYLGTGICNNMNFIQERAYARPKVLNFIFQHSCTIIFTHAVK